MFMHFKGPRNANLCTLIRAPCHAVPCTCKRSQETNTRTADNAAVFLISCRCPTKKTLVIWSLRRVRQLLLERSPAFKTSAEHTYTSHLLTPKLASRKLSALRLDPLGVELLPCWCVTLTNTSSYPQQVGYVSKRLPESGMSNAFSACVFVVNQSTQPTERDMTHNRARTASQL